MKFNFISVELLVTFGIVVIVYCVGFYPIINTTIQGMVGMDSLTAFVASLIPLCFLVAIVLGLFSYARGQRPEGVFGGDAF